MRPIDRQIIGGVATLLVAFTVVLIGSLVLAYVVGLGLRLAGVLGCGT